MSAAVTARNLGKRYVLGAAVNHHVTLRKALTDGFRTLGRRALGRAGEGVSDQEIWALRDVSFDVEEGEVLGIVGRNGAGKSTLLKVVSNVTTPTTGEVITRGTVGSLLEVGTGLHPELTGRENVFLTGSILGLRQRDLRRKYDDIVEFSGLDKFLETPIKHYSSGMQLRLAFSVAAHVEPDILVIDEVLAVGDAEFQRRCLQKLEEHVQAGRTILLTSHDLGAIQSLCTRALWIEEGAVAADGPPADVIRRYLAAVAPAGSSVELDSERGGEGFVGQTLTFTNEAGVHQERFVMGERWKVRFDFETEVFAEAVVATLSVLLPPSVQLLTLRSHAVDLDPGSYRVTFDVWIPLRPGEVRLTPALYAGASEVYRADESGSVLIEAPPAGSPLVREASDLVPQPPEATIWGRTPP